ncbi:MAG TPA: nucleoside diphosphate kinase regulator [Syntrophorhabdus sp.]|jgi:regulator of nucleoside diphosphate kinase|nr:nucleoside diphosphate kinase regulator [Syntrophorhabdus sp.]MDI9558720.1 nucleoside diphosphate kinase regulator [Pseudomonadota bacterium]OQB76046.1 MAG: Regulator of nucleoside diphosphate kinase [Deltaproteobacteria bacterium ADurb.Bin135]MBP8744370.1 nucleoside diphosphate kinase regulator [Syntrophorhabdus sp.]NMC93743.1 nucleoside diphosphate kinase regulator [Syntrophorhabdus sp.]
MRKREIFVTQRDMERLQALIEIGGRQDAAYLESLEEELDQAKVVDPKDIPNDVVTMNSTVLIKDLDSNEEKTLVLVFPGKTNINENAISILAPLGTALIGYREGDIIDWEVPSGKKRIQVIKVVYQPERAGDYQV